MREEDVRKGKKGCEKRKKWRVGRGEHERRKARE